MDVSVWKPERAEGPLPVVYLNVFQGDGAPVWEACQEAGCPPFALVAVGGLDWNRDLSPWGCEATTRSDEPFAGGAHEHLEKLLSAVIPQVEDGLPWPVAWRGIAGLLDWCTGRPLAASPDVAYLSLGKREHKTPNRMMRGVLDATRGFEALLRERGVETTLELNPGNHFCEPDARTARGIAWLLRA